MNFEVFFFLRIPFPSITGVACREAEIRLLYGLQNFQLTITYANSVCSITVSLYAPFSVAKRKTGERTGGTRT